MKARALYKDVSVSELMTLREQGLTNPQIADRPGVSYITVWRAIGPQPDGLKAKPRRKEAPLPPVGDTPLPDMPHESFKERRERLFARAEARIEGADSLLEQVTETTAPASPVGTLVIPAGDAPQVPEADKAREAHMKLMEEAVTTRRLPIHELLAVFGTKTVRAYLKVALYAYGNPHVNLMDHDEMLSALKILNMEADAV